MIIGSPTRNGTIVPTIPDELASLGQRRIFIDFSWQSRDHPADDHKGPLDSLLVVRPLSL